MLIHVISWLDDNRIAPPAMWEPMSPSVCVHRFNRVVVVVVLFAVELLQQQ